MKGKGIRLQQSFESIYRKWYPEILNLTYRIVLDEDLAKEATQRTFIQLFRHYHRLDEIRNFRHWICRIAINAARDILRQRNRKHNPDPLDSVTFEAEGQVTEGCMHQLEQIHLRKIFHEIFRRLPEEPRTVVVLKIYHDMTFQEISQILNISVNTVKSRFYRGIQLIRLILEEKKLIEEI